MRTPLTNTLPNPVIGPLNVVAVAAAAGVAVELLPAIETGCFHHLSPDYLGGMIRAHPARCRDV
jgi:hypothetical protein